MGVDSNGNGTGRRLSGFAGSAPSVASGNPTHSQEYWDEVMSSGKTRREEQRERAMRQLQEGTFGGDQRSAKKTGRKTAHEIVAEHVATQADVIIRKLDGMVRNSRPEVQAMGIDRMLAIEAKVEKDRRDDEKAVLALSGKELDRELLKEIATALGGVPTFDGTAEELDDVEELESGEEDEYGDEAA